MAGEAERRLRCFKYMAACRGSVRRLGRVQRMTGTQAPCESPAGVGFEAFLGCPPQQMQRWATNRCGRCGRPMRTAAARGLPLAGARRRSVLNLYFQRCEGLMRQASSCSRTSSTGIDQPGGNGTDPDNARVADGHAASLQEGRNSRCPCVVERCSMLRLRRVAHACPVANQRALQS